MNGFFNILKPPGMSSAAVVGVVKRLTGERHVGHAGTLDPEAAGVLPVMVGRAARLFDYLADKEKTYVAECAFGCATDTQDAQGRVTETGDHWPDPAALREAAARLTGDIRQRPSAYSAIKQGGKPLYARARAGEQVEAPERVVHVERIELMGMQPDHGLLMRVDCGRGTYIRTLCHDMGRLTGCPAHMRFLLRTRTGAFDLSTAATLEELAAWQKNGELAEHLLPPEFPLQHLPSVRVKNSFARLAKNGTAVPLSETLEGTAPEGALVRVHVADSFLGIALRDGQRLVWRMLLPAEEKRGVEEK